MSEHRPAVLASTIHLSTRGVCLHHLAGLVVEEAGEHDEGTRTGAGQEVVVQLALHPAADVGQQHVEGPVDLVQGCGASAHSVAQAVALRSEEHTSELQSIMRISY